MTLKLFILFYVYLHLCFFISFFPFYYPPFNILFFLFFQIFYFFYSRSLPLCFIHLLCHNLFFISLLSSLFLLQTLPFFQWDLHLFYSSSDLTRRLYFVANLKQWIKERFFWQIQMVVDLIWLLDWSKLPKRSHYGLYYQNFLQTSSPHTLRPCLSISTQTSQSLNSKFYKLHPPPLQWSTLFGNGAEISTDMIVIACPEEKLMESEKKLESDSRPLYYLEEAIISCNFYLQLISQINLWILAVYS